MPFTLDMFKLFKGDSDVADGFQEVVAYGTGQDDLLCHAWEIYMGCDSTRRCFFVVTMMEVTNQILELGRRAEV